MSRAIFQGNGIRNQIVLPDLKIESEFESVKTKDGDKAAVSQG